MKLKKWLFVLLALILCFGLTACGSSVSSNTEIYFSQVGTILNNLFSTTDTSSKPNASASAGAQLAAPSDFAVDADGNYSFKGSEGAEYYLLYFCAPNANSDEDTFIYSSSPITDDGSDSYRGRCADLFDYAYGEYLVKVYAFPDLTDSEHSMSTAATANYVYSGEQSAPELYYYWNTFDNIMGVQIANMDDYLYEAYPDLVEVTFTNVDDSSDKVTVTIEGVSASNYGGETGDLTRGATYDVSAVATSASEYVTNSKSDTTKVSDGLTLGDCHLFTDGYSYSDGFANNIFCWAIVGDSFDLATGGEAGHAVSSFGGNVAFNATPTEARTGSAYSYDLLITAMMPVSGTMEVYADGTFEAQFEGVGPIQSSTIQGSWVDNGDGTVTLNYNHGTITIT